MSKKLLRKKLALMLSTLKKKRKYFCELEYLESTGTQYIDTGLLSTANSKVDCIFGFSSMESGVANNVGVFGGRNANTSNTFTFFKIASGNPQYFRFDYNGQATVATANQMTWNTTSKYRFEYDGTNCITTNTTTGESETTSRSPASSFTSYPIHVFAVNTTGTKGQYLSGRIYRYWYTDGTNTIDLIPVLDWDLVPCMYDKISGQLFYNQGSGTFQYGREIHYVDYLESTGTQYIDTGIVGDLSTEINCEAAIIEAGNASVTNIMGNNVTSSRAITINMSANITNPSPSRIRFGNTDNTTIAGAVNLNTFYKYNTNKTALTVKDTNNTVLNTYGFNATTAFTTNGNILIYKLGDTSTQYIGKIQVRSASIISNGILVRDYLPAIDENGVGFMFDRVTHTIYDNAGTGAFKYPAREVEYIQSTGTQYIDTGIKPTDDYGYRIKNTYTAGGGEQCAIGCMDAGNRFVGIYTSGSANAVSGAWGDYVGFLPSYSWTTGTILDVKCNYKNSRKIVIDDTEMKDISSIQISGTISNTLYIGARHYGTNVTKMQGKIYSAEITNNTDTVADFIPALQDGQAGMLDKVNSVFYPNAGTGNFVAGRVRESEWE